MVWFGSAARFPRHHHASRDRFWIYSPILDLFWRRAPERHDAVAGHWSLLRRGPQPTSRQGPRNTSAEAR